MARIMRLPSEAELPEGTVRDFAELLFWLYRAAHRPALRDISEKIRKNDDLRGTASTETIRRMLRGTTVPANWAIVEAVYLTFCDLAGLDPYWTVTYKEQQETISRLVTRAWHSALDNPDWYYGPPEPPADIPGDPWTDEPPF